MRDLIYHECFFFFSCHQHWGIDLQRYGALKQINDKTLLIS
jgi:hypothetical protein